MMVTLLQEQSFIRLIIYCKNISLWIQHKHKTIKEVQTDIYTNTDTTNKAENISTDTTSADADDDFVYNYYTKF